MSKYNHFNEENPHEMQYSLLTEVMGRWKADILESFLMAEEIEVVLVPGNVSDLFASAFAPVKIFVRKESLQRARHLLETFDDPEEGQEDTGEAEDGE
jgi:hypothetical protein